MLRCDEWVCLTRKETTELADLLGIHPASLPRWTSRVDLLDTLITYAHKNKIVLQHTQLGQHCLGRLLKQLTPTDDKDKKEDKGKRDEKPEEGFLL